MKEAYSWRKFFLHVFMHATSPVPTDHYNRLCQYPPGLHSSILVHGSCRWAAADKGEHRRNCLQENVCENEGRVGWWVYWSHYWAVAALIAPLSSVWRIHCATLWAFGLTGAYTWASHKCTYLTYTYILFAWISTECVYIFIFVDHFPVASEQKRQTTYNKTTRWTDINY